MSTLSPPPDPTRLVRVLFVDDEKSVLDGLRRGMYGMRAEWDMTFASSGAEAIAMMQTAPPDVIVSDMRMPGMNGRDLLIEVKRLYPQIVRFILSGYADATSVMQVAGTAHQYLAKPCETAALKAAIARTFALRNLLQDKRLLQLIGRAESLPSLPSIYQRIVACLRGPEPELADVARIISCDVVMTAMVLKLANSAFFGAKQTFRTADRAVSFLGVETIAGLVLAHSIFKESATVEKSGLCLEELWEHSLRTATGARALARYEKWSPERAEEAFLAGVVHDLGKLVLATRTGPLPDDSTEVARAGATSEDSHAEVGAYLLGLWGFSDTVIEAVAYHHAPSKSGAGKLELAGLLHIADRLAHRSGPSTDSLGEVDLEAGYLESIGLTGRLVEWQAVWAKTGA
jgi:HD-like signal output (HDOD) protein/ActR/RegA family two-component response regulator